MYDGAVPGRLGGVGQLGGRDGMSLVSDLIQMVGPRGRINIVDNSGTGLNFAGGMPPVFAITGGPGGHALRIPTSMRPPSLSRFASFFGGRGGAGRLESNVQSQSNDPSGTIAFTPTMTHERWKDETKVIYGIEECLVATKSLFSMFFPVFPELLSYATPSGL